MESVGVGLATKARQMSSLQAEAAGVASMMALLVGAMHLALAVLDMAAVVELFSQPLLRARTGAAALVVILAQAEALFAVKLKEILSWYPFLHKLFPKLLHITVA